MDIALKTPRSGRGPAESEFRGATDRSTAEQLGAALLVNIGNEFPLLHSEDIVVPGGPGG